MSISITGGVHFGSDDGAPYYSLSAQIGTLPTIAVAVGPITSLSISGGFTEGLLPPALSGALAGNILDILPPPIHALVNFEQGNGPGLLAILGGTHIELPLVVTNPILLN